MISQIAELSCVYTRQHVARQHVAFNMLLVAGNKIVAVCCWMGYMLSRYRQHVAGKKLLVAGNMLPSVNAALFVEC